MIKVSKNLLMIVGGVLVFAVGVGLGLSLKLEWRPEAPVSKSVLENKTVQSTTLSVSGKVLKIVDQEITLEQEGDSFSFAVGKETPISRFETPPPDLEVAPEEISPPAEERIGLEDIQVGDWVSALLEKTSGEEIVARNIIVIVE